MQMRLRRSKYALCRHGSHSIAIAVIVIVGQRMNHQIRERGRDRGRGLVADRKDAIEIAGRERQLVLTDFVTSHSLHLAQDLANRCPCHVASHGSGHHERPRSPSPLERREGAVGIAVRFTQVQVDPRREEAAQHRIHHHRVEVVRRAACQADMTDAQLRLRGIELGDDARQLSALRRVDGRHDRGWLVAYPIAEQCVSESARHRRRHVAGDHQCRCCGTISRGVEGTHVIAGQRADTSRVAIGGQCISYVRGIQRPRELFIGESARFGALLQKLRESFFPQPRDFTLGKRGGAQQVAHECQCRRKLRRESGERDRGDIPVGVRFH